ncbi:MAG: Unknown protein [uncultured Sulfurovum sp.]|uniref:N-linked glycosylation glycosyltransferase PglG n=1 Tax=uncultured Sulfurovum sp. TaxID=269237 RepID=A0A6S6U5S3_9BACT|nr:MAG: Unknown protein [uncultured Sulfurovum sp.]
MQTLVHVYEYNREMIEKFLLASLHKQHLHSLNKVEVDRLSKMLKSFELAYATDSHYIQTTPNYFRDHTEKAFIGEDKSSLMEIESIEDKGAPELTSPYISSASGNLVVTVVIPGEEQHQFFDFSVKELLIQFGIIESHKQFDAFSRFIYMLMGGGLIFISLFAIGYAFYWFYQDLISVGHGFTLESIFKPVIALTLALAFFDLGKTIIRHEVFSKSENLEVFDAKSFITFLTSIMIALLIEALLSVFKISLDGYEKMPYAAMLIVSLALLFFVFTLFIKNVGVWTKKEDK